MSSGMNLVNFNMTITVTRRQRSQHFEGHAQALLLICSMLTGAWRISPRFRLSKSRSRMQTEDHKSVQRNTFLSQCITDRRRLARLFLSHTWRPSSGKRRCKSVSPEMSSPQLWSKTRQTSRCNTRGSRCFWIIWIHSGCSVSVYMAVNDASQKPIPEWRQNQKMFHHPQDWLLRPHISYNKPRPGEQFMQFGAYTSVEQQIRIRIADILSGGNKSSWSYDAVKMFPFSTSGPESHEIPWTLCTAMTASVLLSVFNVWSYLKVCNSQPWPPCDWTNCRPEQKTKKAKQQYELKSKNKQSSHVLPLPPLPDRKV